MSDKQLAHEHDQLAREQGLLGMPFLNEDLPFLAEFDGYPEVSVERALDILEAENSNTTAAAAEIASAVDHDMGAFNALEVSSEDLMVNNGSALMRLVPSPPPRLTPTWTYTIPLNSMLMSSSLLTLLLRKLSPAYRQSFVAGCDADENSTHASTSSSAATSSTTAPDPGAFKKSCKVCATRKVKCEIITGSNPRLCKYCQEKGLACEFELKKSRQKRKISMEDSHNQFNSLYEQ
ncbi:hypothetical protein KCU69_g59, partial [Aureobasidium melanogenum]